MSKQVFFEFLEKSLKIFGIVYLVFGLYAVGFRVIDRLFPGAFHSPLFFILFLAICLYSASLVKRLLLKKKSCQFGIFRVVQKLSFLHIIAVGLILRVLWVVFTDTALIVDAYSYYVHAKNLVFNGYYGFDGGQPDAFWPPGYPLFLAIFMLIFGETETILPLSNLVLYLITMAGVVKFAQFNYNDTIAKIAALVLVIWPNYIFLTNTGAKEAVVIALMSWAIYCYFNFLHYSKLSHLLLAAVLVGMMVLVQPSLGVIFVALIITHFLSTRNIISSTALICVLVLGMVLVVSPWTIRNYQLYNAIIPVSTNGGVLFYSNNNNQVTPGYNDPPPSLKIDYPDPVEQSSKGFELGLSWIKENPKEFLYLSYHKGLYYLGNDDPSLWQIFNYRGEGSRTFLYYIANMIINLFWIWIMAVILLRIHLGKNKLDSFENFVTLSFLGLLMVDMLFEAGTRHHMPLYPLMAILCAKALRSESHKEDQEFSS